MKPMLAGKVDLSILRYPVLVSPKMDGIRAIKKNGKLWSRQEKLIPNRHIQTWAARNVIDGWDGELLLRDTRAPYREVASAVMSRDGEPDFVFMVFDWATPKLEFEPFTQRLNQLKIVFPRERVEVMSHLAVGHREELDMAYADAIEEGYEGIMIRDPNGRYLRGRSTARSQELLKMKLVEDEEAEVLSLVEEVESSNLANPTGKNQLGVINCRFDDGVLFQCGSGFTRDERQAFWKQPDLIVGKRVTIKHQPAPGGRNGEKPRFPIFKGIRHD